MGVSVRCNKSTGDVRCEASAWRRLSTSEQHERPLLDKKTKGDDDQHLDQCKRKEDRSKAWQSCKLLASKKIAFNINDDENLCYIWPTANNDDDHDDDDDDDDNYVAECQRNTGRSIDLQAPLALSSPTLCNLNVQRAQQRRRRPRHRRPKCKMVAVDRWQQQRRKRHIGVESCPSISSSASVTSDSDDDDEQAGNCFARKLTHTHAPPPPPPGSADSASLTLHNSQGHGHSHGTIDVERGLDVAQQLRNCVNSNSGCHNEQQLNGDSTAAAGGREIKTKSNNAEILINRTRRQVEKKEVNKKLQSTSINNMGIGARLAESSCALVESLARTCASSSSGSYKVAQVSGGAQQPTDTSAINSRPEVKVKSSAWARAGRSPSSLQRQTNARLARHRAKIQAQRHEQLANLALRERQTEMPTAANGGHNSQQQQQQQQSTSANATTSQQFAEVIEVLPLVERLNTTRPDDLPQTSSSSSRVDNFITQLLNWRQSSSSSSRRSTRSENFSPNERDYSIITITQEPQQQQRQLVADRLLELALPTTTTTTRSSSQRSRTQSSIRRGTIRRNAAQQQQDLERANVIVYRSPSEVLQQNPHTSGAAQPQRQPVALLKSSNGWSKRFHPPRPMGATDDAMSINSSSCSSSSSSSTLSLAYGKPFCKICHLSSSKHGDKLISPCKCSGTMQYIHCGCLLKWLEISNRTNEKQPMACELCAHEYTWHKRFNFQQMKLPKCSKRDIILHLTFILALGVMMFCALAPIFKQTSQQQLLASDTIIANQQATSGGGGVTFGGDQEQPASRPGNSRRFKNGPANHNDNLNGLAASFNTNNNGRLASDEKFILFCAASFFIFFFVAIYAQTKARDTLYGLMVKFANMNLTYYITEYDHGNNQSSATNSKSIITTTTAPANDYEQATRTLIDTRKSSSSSGGAR